MSRQGASVQIKIHIVIYSVLPSAEGLLMFNVACRICLGKAETEKDISQRQKKPNLFFETKKKSSKTFKA